jgi:protein O-GlcNAc transferase
MDPDRRLKVGFISPDFFKSAAATGFEPFLDGYNRDALQVYGYSNLMAADEVTQRIVRKTHQMRDVRYLDAARIAEMIDADQIDILVEIGGHVHGHLRIGQPLSLSTTATLTPRAWSRSTTASRMT